MSAGLCGVSTGRPRVSVGYLRGVCGYLGCPLGACGASAGRPGQHLQLRRRLLASPVHGVTEGQNTNSLRPLHWKHARLPPFLPKGKAAGPPAAGSGAARGSWSETVSSGHGQRPARRTSRLVHHEVQSPHTLGERQMACPWLDSVPKFTSCLERPTVADIRN